MEESINAMEQLLQECGKDPNQDQKKTYYMAVYQLLNEEGFSDNVQKYINKGFKFVKMRPFRAYFSRMDDSGKEALLNQLFNSEFLKKDKSRAFAALINLLALFISNKIDYRYCKKVVREITNYCYNKEGKILGNANGTMMNSFYSDLAAVSNEFDYEKLFDSEEIRVQFEELLYDSIEYASSVRKLTTRQKDALVMVREWVPRVEAQLCHDNAEEKMGSVVDNLQNDVSKQHEKLEESPVEPETDDVLLKQNNSRTMEISDYSSNISNEDNQSTMETTEKTSEDSASSVSVFPAILEQLLHRIDRLSLSVERTNGNTEFLIRTQQAYIDSLKSSIEMEKANSEHIRERNIELMEEARDLQKKIEDLRIHLAEKEEETRSLKAMLEVSSKEGDRRFNEEIMKLTEKLRFEYQDYMSVKNIAMSIELGENMRGQLGDVFGIMKKAGLDIDS